MSLPSDEALISGTWVYEDAGLRHLYGADYIYQTPVSQSGNTQTTTTIRNTSTMTKPRYSYASVSHKYYYG